MRNLSKQLFHGSPMDFKEGDLITPQEEETHAFATNSRFHARDYGHVYEVEPVDKTDLIPFKEEGLKATHYMSPSGFRVKGRA